jgi:23S rRNA pseudouridine1911/1915/1917 synthase
VSAGEEVTFTAEQEDERLDVFLADRFPDVSRSQIKRLIKSQAVTVNDQPSKPSYRVEPGDRITVHLPEEKEEPIRPEEIPLDIVYEDDHMLAVNKPAGMVVHPGAGHSSGTLVNALLAYLPAIADVGGLERAGIVHRLDKDTSGVLLVAKDPDVLSALQRQFKRRQVRKSYLALVEDQVYPPEGIIEAPVGRDRKRRKQMSVRRSGRPSVTQYRVIESFPEHSLLEVRPHTGRTHQVRVHLAWMGYPLVGDRTYGRRRQRLLKQRHFLHAQEIEITHPVSGESLTVTAPLPPELQTVLRTLRRR